MSVFEKKRDSSVSKSPGSSDSPVSKAPESRVIRKILRKFYQIRYHTSGPLMGPLNLFNAIRGGTLSSFFLTELPMIVILILCRAMGAHVSKIKHLKLDQWEDAQVKNKKH